MVILLAAAVVFEKRRVVGARVGGGFWRSGGDGRVSVEVGVVCSDRRVGGAMDGRRKRRGAQQRLYIYQLCVLARCSCRAK